MPNNLNNILYIEDDEGLARLLQRRLERQRFHVDIAGSAEDGIDKIKARKYDLILLDYHLPGLNGLEALDIILKMDHAAPVILLTASGDERVAVSALEKGAADYAVKDAGQGYFDLLPAVMQAAYTKEFLLKENLRQREELNAAKEKAEAANLAKSNFLATMSHEIRTPLNVVTGLTAILAKTSLNPEQEKILKTLRSNADLLLKLINDLLDISRIEDGHINLEATQFEFSSVLDDIMHMFQDVAQQKQLHFHVNDITQGMQFLGDRTRIQQIVMNLVSNAIKFTESGEIEVKTEFVEREGQKPCIKLTVRDTGIGIAAEKLPHIFDKFTQADETITRRYGGSGLGLCIAHSLSKLMDGDITVESTPGKGSTFTVILCLQSCDNGVCDTKILVAPQTDNSTAQANRRVLLVEDYAPNILVATMMLEDIGFEVESCDNGLDAIAKIEQCTTPYYAILMDVQMQDMDGLETTRRIRQLEQKKGFKHTIIGVTAHALAGDRERCITAGMDDYMSKPIHPEILAAKLTQLK